MKLLLFKYLFFLLSGFIFPENISVDPNAVKIYPVPPSNENSLFYIQRSKNTNAIVYEVNKNSDGKIDIDEPVKVYWIRYTSDSTTADLTPLQRKYAYGIEGKYNKQKDSFVLQFSAYKKRNIYLLPVSNGKKYVAFTSINGKLAELKKIFVSTSGGTFWFPKIDYVELSGKDPSTNLFVSERFKP